jgi:hypothetical protein
MPEPLRFRTVTRGVPSSPPLAASALPDSVGELVHGATRTGEERRGEEQRREEKRREEK